MQKKTLEREWKKLEKAEQKYLERNFNVSTAGWQDKVAKHVPDKLEDTLNSAFGKAFGLVFEKGTGVIEKTYQ